MVGSACIEIHAFLEGGAAFTVPEAANDLSQKIGQGIVHVREVM